MNSSVVLMPNWIGDMLLALSIVERLPERRRLQTTLLVPGHMGALVSLLSDLPQIEFARTDADERNRTVHDVRSRGFHTMYLLPFSFSSAWFAMKTGVPVRRGLSLEMRRFLLNEPLPGKLRDKSSHITLEYAKILDTPYSPPDEWIGKKVKPDHSHAGSIVFCPGAIYGPAKKWRHFPNLALLKERDKIVILGKPEDRESAMEIVRIAPGRVTDLTGNTSLTEAASIMAGARAVVSNDSGLMHLAAFIGTPVIGLFGSTSPIWTRPLGKKSIAMNFPEPCAPCFDHKCRYEHYRCLENITPNIVAEAIDKLCVSN
ncbi:MAG: lipopolysaccharide heptosyltransferase II [Chlorobiaceae bacterium]|jgi:heptosyltransferase II|nr:lipopolysaccharide heptosyltransferase II [Chlorobiaceae bacterium]